MAKKDAATTTSNKLEALVDGLVNGDRKTRQTSAHALALRAQSEPESLVGYISDLVGAASRKEAQTRWESLDALAHLAQFDIPAVEACFESAQECLYDEESGLVRAMAFKYFAYLGSCSHELSSRVWPLLDEAVQCYHGDPEFSDMLNDLEMFACADIDREVRAALIDRMTFDATSGKGMVVARAAQIIERAQATSKK